MFVAEKLRKSNIAEYLLYMWQVEDLLRAFHLDFEKFKVVYLSRYTNLSDEPRRQLEEWYENMIQMMHREGVAEHGHLQINKNVIQNLSELHTQLMNSSKFPYYRAAYFNALPIIVELRMKNGQKQENELETCFEFLYGIMLLRIQQKTVSEETEKALKTISTFVGMLSDYYKKDREEPLEF
ncbi:MAG: DUF4924 family protein [Bacteroidaceae bacterium]